MTTKEERWELLKEAFKVNEFEPLGYKEVAESLDLSYATARAWVHEAHVEGKLVKVTATDRNAKFQLPTKMRTTTKSSVVHPEKYVLGTSTHAMVDMANPGYGVQVELEDDRMWVHVDGITVLRIQRIPDLILTDRRSK
jgi:transposase